MAVCSRLAMSPRAAPPVYCNGATPDNCVGKISPISSPSATTKCATRRSRNQLVATDGDLLPTAGELRLIYRPNNKTDWRHRWPTEIKPTRPSSSARGFPVPARGFQLSHARAQRLEKLAAPSPFARLALLQNASRQLGGLLSQADKEP